MYWKNLIILWLLLLFSIAYFFLQERIKIKLSLFLKQKKAKKILTTISILIVFFCIWFFSYYILTFDKINYNNFWANRKDKIIIEKKPWTKLKLYLKNSLWKQIFTENETHNNNFKWKNEIKLLSNSNESAVYIFFSNWYNLIILPKTIMNFTFYENKKTINFDIDVKTWKILLISSKINEDLNKKTFLWKKQINFTWILIDKTWIKIWLKDKKTLKYYELTRKKIKYEKKTYVNSFLAKKPIKLILFCKIWKILESANKIFKWKLENSLENYSEIKKYVNCN